MAVRARPSPRPILVGALVALALSAASCSGNVSQAQQRQAAPTTARPETAADPRLDELADDVGCSATKPPERNGRFTGVLMCAIDGETTTRIHTFEAPDRTSVERRFSEAIGDSPGGGIECDGGTFRFIVLGDDWLVLTNDRVVAGNLVVDRQAEFVGPDAEPPTSGVRDPCG